MASMLFHLLSSHFKQQRRLPPLLAWVQEDSEWRQIHRPPADQTTPQPHGQLKMTSSLSWRLLWQHQSQLLLFPPTAKATWPAPENRRAPQIWNSEFNSLALAIVLNEQAMLIQICLKTLTCSFALLRNQQTLLAIQILKSLYLDFGKKSTVVMYKIINYWALTVFCTKKLPLEP